MNDARGVTLTEGMSVEVEASKRRGTVIEIKRGTVHIRYRDGGYGRHQGREVLAIDE